MVPVSYSRVGVTKLDVAVAQAEARVKQAECRAALRKLALMAAVAVAAVATQRPHYNVE